MYGAPTPKDPNVDIPRSRVGVFDKVLKTISRYLGTGTS